MPNWAEVRGVRSTSKGGQRPLNGALFWLNRHYSIKSGLASWTYNQCSQHGSILRKHLDLEFNIPQPPSWNDNLRKTRLKKKLSNLAKFIHTEWDHLNLHFVNEIWWQNGPCTETWSFTQEWLVFYSFPCFILRILTP